MMTNDSRHGWVLLPAILLVTLAAAEPALAADPNPPSIHSTRGAWPIKRQWNTAEVRHFARWVEHIYDAKTNGCREQRLAKLERVLRDRDINLLLDPEFIGESPNPDIGTGAIRALHGIVDCAKLTQALAGYYSYRRGLPWMVSHVRSCDGTDLRTARRNIPRGTVSSFDYPSAHRFLIDAVQGFCTGNYRVEPGSENWELSDTVPLTISRDHVLPGALFYLDGHVLMLGKIAHTGHPRFLDSTVSRTRAIRTECGLNAVSGIPPSGSGNPHKTYAGCFRGFLTFRFPIAETNEDGKVVRVRRRTDAEMVEFGYGLEQYDVMRELYDTGCIVDGPTPMDSFHEFVMFRLRNRKRFAPVRLFEQAADRLLAMGRDRETEVRRGWRDVRENGPITFPEDMFNNSAYTARGRWGAFATAEYDACIRAEYFRLADSIEAAIRWFDRAPYWVDLRPMNRNAIWSRSDLALALLREKKRVFDARRFTWTDSRGIRHTMSLSDMEERLYDMSFDPNHPPEVRWGLDPMAYRGDDAPTRLPDGRLMPMAEAYKLEAYYRILAHCDYEESYLVDMFANGFMPRPTIENRLGAMLVGGPEGSPPLAQRGTRIAWLRSQARERYQGKR